MDNDGRRSFSDFGPADEPGAPGSAPHPEHRLGVPGAPATNPPEPPVVPTNSALAEIWNAYGPSTILIAVGLVIVILLLFRFEF